MKTKERELELLRLENKQLREQLDRERKHSSDLMAGIAQRQAIDVYFGRAGFDA